MKKILTMVSLRFLVVFDVLTMIFYELGVVGSPFDITAPNYLQNSNY